MGMTRSRAHRSLRQESRNCEARNTTNRTMGNPTKTSNATTSPSLEMPTPVNASQNDERSSGANHREEPRRGASSATPAQGEARESAVTAARAAARATRMAALMHSARGGGAYGGIDGSSVSSQSLQVFHPVSWISFRAAFRVFPLLTTSVNG